MAVDQERGPGHEAGLHGQSFTGIELDQEEALPAGTVPFRLWPDFVQEGFFELEDFLDVHAGDQGLSCSGRGVGKNDVFEFIAGGRKNGGALVHFGGIEEIEHGKMLDLEDLVHALDAESTFAIEEVGDMSLFESRLLSKAEPGQFTCFDAVPEDFTEIILQDFELHQRSIAAGYGAGLSANESSSRGIGIQLDCSLGILDARGCAGISGVKDPTLSPQKTAKRRLGHPRIPTEFCRRVIPEKISAE